MNNNELHNKAIEVARNYKRCEIELIDVLEKVDTAKVCYHHGCSSTFKYAVEILGLSEAVAHIFINVSRKTREVPELKKEIRNGSITVSKAKKMTSVINQENSIEWIERARVLSTRQLEKAVATESPKDAAREKVKYVSEDRLQLQLGVSEELLQKFHRVQDILSQKKGHNVDLEEALDEMSSEFLERNDPVKKAERQKNRKGGHVTSRSRRIPAAVRHQLYLKSKGRCMSDGCENQRFLDIHHVLPVSKGGGNQLENLQLLCKGHHRAEHLAVAESGKKP